VEAVVAPRALAMPSRHVGQSAAGSLAAIMRPSTTRGWPRRPR